MIRSRWGTTLAELIFAMGLGLTILGVGYRAYTTVSRCDEYGARLESMNLTANSLMSRIKQDVRNGNMVVALGNTVVLNTSDRRVNYEAKRDGVLRMDRYGRCLYRGINATFVQSGRGLDVKLRSESKVHGRRIRVDVSGFVCPRN